MSNWLVLHGGALGDLALTLRLALRLPGVAARGQLDLVARSDPGDLSGCRPSVRRSAAEGLQLHWLYAEAERVPERLQTLVAGRDVLNMLSGANSRVHERLRRAGARRVYSVDPRPRADSQTHITDQWRRALERQGLRLTPGDTRFPALTVPDELRARGRALLASLPGQTLHPQPASPGAILIHPGSGGRAKCWPLPCFCEVARRLRRRKLDVLLLVGPAEVERWPAHALRTMGAEFPLVVAPEPNELLALLTAADVLLANDAGPAHLAALLGTPTVTIFGPTCSGVWHPLGSAARWLQGDPDRCPADWGVRPEQVVEEVVRAGGAGQTRPPAPRRP